MDKPVVSPPSTQETNVPQQNRVDPFSTLHAVGARGMFTGNRGRLHKADGSGLIHQRWASDSWVICSLASRESGQTGSNTAHLAPWTNLFFLDEAVGLAAGHRPCHGCRKTAAQQFRLAIQLNRVSQVNEQINAEMKCYLRARNPKPRPTCTPSLLPDGAFFAVEGRAFLKWQDAAFAFSFEGYGRPGRLPDTAQRLTPQRTCDALQAGYAPVFHPSLPVAR